MTVLRHAHDQGTEAVDATFMANGQPLGLAGADRPFADEPPVAVVLKVRREHPLLCRRGEHLVPVQRLIPEIEILDRRVQSPGRIGERHVEVVGVTHTEDAALVRSRPPLEEGRGQIVPGCAHAEGIENALLEHLRIALFP